MIKWISKTHQIIQVIEMVINIIILIQPIMFYRWVCFKEIGYIKQTIVKYKAFNDVCYITVLYVLGTHGV